MMHGPTNIKYTNKLTNTHMYINSYVYAKIHHDKQINFSHVKLDVLKDLGTLSRVSLSFAQPVRCGNKNIHSSTYYVVYSYLK